MKIATQTLTEEIIEQIKATISSGQKVKAIEITSSEEKRLIDEFYDKLSHLSTGEIELYPRTPIPSECLSRICGYPVYVVEESVKEHIKPPIGLTPRNIVREQRIDEIMQAINRYHEKNRRIPNKWLAELADLQEETNKITGDPK
jgi:hypothetical protein